MQIAILVYPGMTALDAIGPYEVFNTIPGWELCFTWKEIGPIVTDSGALVLGATHRLADIPRPDVVLVPGSSADTGTVAADSEVLDWLRAVQKVDGSFGESCDSYEDPELKGQGPSTASQTAWGGMSLMNVHGPDDPDVLRAIAWL